MEPYQHSSVSQFPTSDSALSLQPSLLTIGMRIRKSVPEGYKTRVSRSKSPSSLDELAFFVDSENCQPPQSGGAGDSILNSTSTGRIPSCRLHQVGGLVQAFSSAPETAVPAMAQEDDEAGVTSSSNQGSKLLSHRYSTASSTSRKKRVRASEPDDRDDDLITAFPSCGNRFPLGSSPSPTYPYSHTYMPDLTAFSSPPIALRPIAQPSSRFHKKTVVDAKTSGRVGQESILQALEEERAEGGSHSDFDEAAFLEPLEDVEMSGC
ncbi:MAG: hypothetical protein Q9160_006831 [Pyrenula sp. 1 TL-2023]